MSVFLLSSLLISFLTLSQVPGSNQLIEDMSKHAYPKPVQIEQEVTFSQYPNLVISEVWDFIHPLKVYLKVTLPTQPPIELNWQYIDSSKIGPLISQRSSKANSGFITEALWLTTPSTTLLNLLESSGWHNLQVRLSKQQGQIAHHLFVEESQSLYQGIWINQQTAQPLRVKTVTQCDVQYENQNLKKLYQFQNQTAFVYLNKSTPISFFQQSQTIKPLPQQINLATQQPNMDSFVRQALLFYERCR